MKINEPIHEQSELDFFFHSLSVFGILNLNFWLTFLLVLSWFGEKNEKIVAQNKYQKTNPTKEEIKMI